MNKKLAGTFFIRNGISLGYCFEATLLSLKGICDHVYVVYVESEDGTLDVLKRHVDEKVSILTCTNDQWNEHQGRTKLALFQNVGIDYAEKAGYEYVLLVQGDECLHEDSKQYIEQALELNEEAYFCTRYNLWKDEEHMLNVPQNRKPCSTVVNRLCKSIYRSIDDGESLATNSASLDFINLIEIFHMGFVRDSKKHIAKIKEIQQNIFQMDYDKRADLKEEFDWKDWGFTEEDLIPIPKRLPKYLTNE